VKTIIIALLKGLGKQALLYILHEIIRLLSDKHDMKEYDFVREISFKETQNAKK
jgi:hypothetical protein